MNCIDGKIIGYIIDSVGDDDSWIEFIIQYYNKETDENNYLLSKSFHMFKEPLKHLSSDSVTVKFDRNVKPKVEKIVFDKKVENKFKLREYTKSEYYKLVVDNNNLTSTELNKIYRKDRRQKKGVQLLPAILTLIISIGIFVLNFQEDSKKSIFICAFCCIFMLFGIILLYLALKKEKYKLSNKGTKMISVEVVEKIEELTSKTVIFKETNQKKPKYYVYYTDYDLFKIGEVYSININKYHQPTVKFYIKIKGYSCFKLYGFVDDDFIEIAKK